MMSDISWGTTEEAVEAAMETLRGAVARDILDDNTVTSKQYNEMRYERDELERQKAEMKRDYDELYRRVNGMSRHLSRIRSKADVASGYENTSGGGAEATIKFRAAGAEGAVDRLIALYCGLLNKKDYVVDAEDD